MHMGTNAGPSALSFQTQASAQGRHAIINERFKVGNIEEVVVRGHSLETVQVSHVFDHAVNWT